MNGEVSENGFLFFCPVFRGLRALCFLTYCTPLCISYCFLIFAILLKLGLFSLFDPENPLYCIDSLLTWLASFYGFDLIVERFKFSANDDCVLLIESSWN